MKYYVETIRWKGFFEKHKTSAVGYCEHKCDYDFSGMKPGSLITYYILK